MTDDTIRAEVDDALDRIELGVDAVRAIVAAEPLKAAIDAFVNAVETALAHLEDALGTGEDEPGQDETAEGSFNEEHPDAEYDEPERPAEGETLPGGEPGS